MRDGERLPSLRRVATLSRLNVKTVMGVYAGLQREGIVVLRKGSGAFVALRDAEGFEPAQAVRLARLLRRHLDEASGMNIAPPAYALLVQRLVRRSNLAGRSVAVLECNEEQVRLYAREIEARIGVAAHPILLPDPADRRAASRLRSASIFAVTDFHFREGTAIARRFRKPLVRLRLQRDFLPALMAAARRGRLAMLVFDTSFFPAFRRALEHLGLDRRHLDRITVVAGADRPAARRAIAGADLVYVSPLCERATRGLLPGGDRLLTFDRHIADDAIEELEAWLLLSSADGTES